MILKQKQYIISQVSSRYLLLKDHLSESSKRLWAIAEATTIGRGGVTIVYEATGIARSTISNGLKELKTAHNDNTNKERKVGGGRKSISQKYPQIIEDLKLLIDPISRGDPESPLLWTSKSTYKITEALINKGHKISQKTVYSLLEDMGYSMQSNKKKEEGKQHIDRDAQFNFINKKTKQIQKLEQPVISVDTKKKENIGNFKNNGKEWEEKGKPTTVNTYDFPDKDKGKASPYGIYDVSKNNGWVNIGISSDTSQFAVNSIRQWYNNMGKEIYPNATDLYIMADGGGSNGYRVRLWKVELQKLSNELNINIHVSHFPPGTSKWNKIEHKMFSFISMNWRGKPLESLSTIVNLIANTTTKEGLKINTSVDKNTYKKGIKIKDEEIEKINIEKDEFHGEWNYIISPS